MTNAPYYTFIKDPGATLDYTVDWTGWLAGSDNDTIELVSWAVSNVNDTAVDAGSPELTIESQSNSTTLATVWLTAGLGYQTYLVACTTTTNGGRDNNQSFYIAVQPT